MPKYEFTLPSALGKIDPKAGRKVILREPTPDDELAAVKLTAHITDDKLRAIETGHHILRHCLISVDGKPTTWKELEGGLLWKPFTPTEFYFIQRAFNAKVNAGPTEAELNGFFQTMTSINE